MSALLDAVVAVSADLELAEVLTRIVSSACNLVDAKYGALGVLAADGERLVEFVTHGVTPAERERIGDPPSGHGVLGLLIREPRPRRLEDIAGHPDSYGFPPGHPPMHSFLGTPVRIRDEVFGNLYMAEKQGAPHFTADDEDMLVALAAAAGVAIENARLYDRSQHQRRWSEAISEMTQVLLEGGEEQSALTLMAARARDLASARLAVVALYDGDGDLIVRAIHGRSGHTQGTPLDAGVGVALVGGHWGEVVASREPLLLLSQPGEQPAEDGAAELRDLGRIEAHGPTALLPIVVGEDNVGLLAVAWGSDVDGGVSDVVAPLAGFAQQSGLALVAARAQLNRARTVLLEDRDRIARDMHDHVIQRLFATGLSLQAASRLAQQSAVRARLEDAVDDLDDAIKDIRRTIFELQHSRAVGGLRDEIEDVVRSSEGSLGFVPNLELGPLAALPSELEADVVAVVREALANVARHARATQVRVHVSSTDELRVEVADDGVGVAPSSARSGLMNLDERARSHGGSLAVRPGEPQGTVLTWKVSLAGR